MKKKEMVSLNSISNEFSNEMDLNERFEVLDKSVLRNVKGGGFWCTNYNDGTSICGHMWADITIPPNGGCGTWNDWGLGTDCGYMELQCGMMS
jgi:hypothetical protein